MTIDASALIAEAEQRLVDGDAAGALRICERIIVHEPQFNRAHVISAKALMPGLRYDQILNRIHWNMKPETYVEIGVATGTSLCRALPETRAIGIDPAPRIEKTIQAQAKIYPLESDVFFERYNLAEELGTHILSLAFIDGLHIFEQALRDLINLEAYAQPDTVLLIHDCYPPTELSAAREAQTLYCCGDVWRMIPMLGKYRPELNVRVVPAFPSGLAIVTGLDCKSTVLSDQFDEIIAEGFALEFPGSEERRAATFPMIDNDWDTISRLIGDSL